jgi:hypothetical protein
MMTIYPSIAKATNINKETSYGEVLRVLTNISTILG